MKIDEIFKRLSVGHLSNLSMSGEGSGDIKTESKAKILGYINSALVKIYSKFALKEREVVISQYAHITNYQLDKRYAMYNEARPPENLPYILDLPAEQFNDDAIKILRVYNNLGDELVLNDSSHAYSLFTPYPTTLQTPYPQEGQIFSVIYQASHEKIAFGNYTAEVKIPVILEEAFLSLIASYVFRDMGGQDNTAKGREHLNAYEVDCALIEQKDHASISTVENSTKFEQRGFV